MALQTTGLEFLTPVADFFENDKYCWWNKSWATLLVLHLLARIYHKGCLCCWRERIGVCFLLADCPKDVRPIMYSK